MKILLFFLIFSSSIFAKTYKQHYQSPDFFKAKTASSFIRFDMESTKLGMMTSSFFGIVKKFDVSFDLDKQTITNAIISFKVVDLDTDVNGRNSKMHDTCFSKDKFPDLIVTLNGPATVGKTKTAMAATINVRGQNKGAQVMLDVVRKGKKLIVTGSSQVTLSGLGITDPSIWVAKVRDRVDLKFNFEIDL